MAGKRTAPRVPPKVSRAARTLAKNKSTHVEKSKAGKTLRKHQETETLNYQQKRI